MQSASDYLQQSEEADHEQGYHFVLGLDVHKDSTAIAAANVARESPQFIGTVGADLTKLLKA